MFSKASSGICSIKFSSSSRLACSVAVRVVLFSGVGLLVAENAGVVLDSRRALARIVEMIFLLPINLPVVRFWCRFIGVALSI